MNLLNEDKVINFKQNYGNAIFVVGGPGSGKSKVVNNLINLANYKVVNSDKFLELYAKKHNFDLKKPSDTFKVKEIINKSAKDIKNNIIKFTNNKIKQNFVFDSTGRNDKEIIENEKTFSNLGFITTLIYVDVNLDIAIKRNNNRDRIVPSEVVKDIHKQVKENIGKLIPVFKNVYHVDNSQNNLEHFRDGKSIKKIK